MENVKNESEKILEIAMKTIEEHKGEDITYLNVENYTPFASYYVLATCNNPRLLNAISEYVEEAFEKNGIDILGKDGVPDSGWMIIQGGDVIVHLFLPVNRKEINLEGFVNELAVRAEKIRNRK